MDGTGRRWGQSAPATLQQTQSSGGLEIQLLGKSRSQCMLTPGLFHLLAPQETPAGKREAQPHSPALLNPLGPNAASR